MRLPEGYRGVVVQKQSEKQAEKEACRQPEEMGGEDEEDGPEKATLEDMQVTAEFDQIVIWGHESTANAEMDQVGRAHV